MVTASDILDYSAADAIAWFQSIASDSSLPETFNWHGLAECSVTRSRNEIDDSDSLHWAHIATTIYDRLSIVHPGASFDRSSMFCRVAMIARHGVRQGNGILDPDTIFNWFREQSLTLPDTNALLQRLDTEPWGDIVVDVLRPLRQLKNRLNVINELALHTDIADDINLYRPLLERLPLRSADNMVFTLGVRHTFLGWSRGLALVQSPWFRHRLLRLGRCRKHFPLSAASE